MKFTTKKKLIGKFFNTKKAQEKEVGVLKEEVPKPEEEETRQPTDPPASPRPDPETNSFEESDKNKFEGEVESDAPREAPEEDMKGEEDTPQGKLPDGTWMGSFLENMTTMCKVPAHGDSVPAILSADDYEEEPEEKEEIKLDPPAAEEHTATMNESSETNMEGGKETLTSPFSCFGAPKQTLSEDAKEDVHEQVDKEPEKNITSGEKTGLSDGTMTVDTVPKEEQVIAKIFKANKKTKMGLSLKNSTVMKGVFVTNLKEGSLFAATDLEEGMKVLSIQDKPCPEVLEDAVAILRQSIGDLKIVAAKAKCEI